MSKPFRRIVTGHDSAGKAIIQSAAPPAREQVIGNGTGPTFYEVWNTRETPAMIDRASGEPFEAQLTLSPPKRGTRIRVLDIPAETGPMDQVDPGAGAGAVRRDRCRRRLDARGFRNTASSHAPHRDHRLRYRPGRRDHPARG